MFLDHLSVRRHIHLTPTEDHPVSNKDVHTYIHIELKFAKSSLTEKLNKVEPMHCHKKTWRKSESERVN